MSKLYFYNNGEFNPTAMLTFGVSAKEKENSIGKFGTGFKYACAVILRLGGSIKVTSLGKEYSFSTNKESIRDKDFDLVYMNGDNAHFTTHFGINWEPWMAFREIYCNMLDEEGIVTEYENELDQWDTVVEVDCTQIYNVYCDMDSYFLKSTPILKDEFIEVHKGVSRAVYYQGVYIGDTDSPCAFTYNFKKGIDLTEERVARYSFQIRDGITRAVQTLLNKKELRHVFHSGKCYENEYWYSSLGISKDYQDLCEELLKTEAGIPECARNLLKEIACDKGEWPEFYLTEIQLKALKKAKEFLKTINVNVDEFPINTVSGLGKGVMGRAFEGQIYLSEMPFNMGVKQLASTLLEEYVHLKLGCHDFDRTMQNYLFDKILSLGEEINQEVL